MNAILVSPMPLKSLEHVLMTQFPSCLYKGVWFSLNLAVLISYQKAFPMDMLSLASVAGWSKL